MMQSLSLARMCDIEIVEVNPDAAETSAELVEITAAPLPPPWFNRKQRRAWAQLAARGERRHA